MRKLQISRWLVLWVVTALGLVCSCVTPGPSQQLLGGARGEVRSVAGNPLEGILVQLIAQNSVRTTVYSNAEGRYEFPQLEAGAYTLRIARPLTFHPYQRDEVQIDGATVLEDIVLEPVSDTEFLPPTPEIMAQLSGAEWMMNLSGTGEEKRYFTRACGFGCHSYQQSFRPRYDERSWRLIVQRMATYSGSPLINKARRARHSEEIQEVIVKWLARVRGPDSEDTPVMPLPGPRGAATRVIVTEYELPRLMMAPHDVAGDSEGNIWYSPHRSPYIGKLDPRTGVVTEYQVPITPDALPGTHWIAVDKNDVVWASENWAHNIVKFDPKTEEFHKAPIEVTNAINSPMGGNFGLAPDGYLWRARGGTIKKIDPETGEYLEQYPLEKAAGAYGNMVSVDGSFYAGGSWPTDFVLFLDIRTGEHQELQTPSRGGLPARGGFDLEGNAWFGGRGGGLVKLDTQTRRVSEYYPPTPYVTFYEAMPDKNGEVWGGELHGGRFARFNPRTERWIEYVLPEPYSHNRRTWIDNSTDPVTVWYVDHNGYMVRIQPLE